MAQSELFEISQKVLANTAQMPLKTKLLFQKTIFSLQLQCCELLVAKKFDHEANDFLNHTLIPALSQARNSSSPYYAQQFEDFQKSLERIMLKVKGTEAEAVYLKSKFGSLLGRKIDS